MTLPEPLTSGAKSVGRFPGFYLAHAGLVIQIVGAPTTPALAIAVFSASDSSSALASATDAKSCQTVMSFSSSTER